MHSTVSGERSEAERGGSGGFATGGGAEPSTRRAKRVESGEAPPALPVEGALSPNNCEPQ